jgi:LasA protease
MLFNAKNSIRKPALALLVLVLFSLACSLGAGSSAQPLFLPPAVEVSWTDIPPSPTSTATLQAISAGAAAIPLPTPIDTPTPEPTQPVVYEQYQAQAGDSLNVVATRWGVDPSEITDIAGVPITGTGFIPPNQVLVIPNRLANTTLPTRLIPDSEVIYSPSTVHFNIHEFVNEAGGYLSTYKEYLRTTNDTSGADIVARVARENSINPRLLLALLEYQSGWVYGQPGNIVEQDYPMGRVELNKRGLYNQLVWAVKEISTGYYGWREATITEIGFSEGITARLAPELNAGTAALQYYFSKLYGVEQWVNALDVNRGLPAVHESMFGDPWQRAKSVEPLYPPGIEQPRLILPFQANRIWSFSGGPHGAWEHEGARAALDFAPGSLESGCVPSDAWVVASAPGLVVRSGSGIVVLDLDGDGYEQTGWVLLYLHIATKDRVAEGTWLDTGDFIGHPSCEGGQSTGTHVHIARKYNGEWIPADGPIPFNLSGWIAKAGDQPYEGYLVKDGVSIPASVYGIASSNIIRLIETP